MIDHAPRIRAQRQAEADRLDIEDMERRAAPLQWAVLAATVALCLALAVNGLKSHFDRFTELAANNEALVACLNGHLIGVGDALIGCDKHEVKLIAQGGDQ